MRRAIPVVLFVALCALPAPAFPVEVHLKAEAARFSLADVPQGVQFLPHYRFVPETRTLERLELHGLGFGLEASIGSAGKRDRMEARFQRSDDSDDNAGPAARRRGFAPFCRRTGQADLAERRLEPRPHGVGPERPRALSARTR